MSYCNMGYFYWIHRSHMWMLQQKWTFVEREFYKFTNADGFKFQIDASIVLWILLECCPLRKLSQWRVRFKWKVNKGIVIKQVLLFLLITPWTAVFTGHSYSSTLGGVAPDNRCILVREAGVARMEGFLYEGLCWCLPSGQSEERWMVERLKLQAQEDMWVKHKGKDIAKKQECQQTKIHMLIRESSWSIYIRPFWIYKMQS